MRILIYTHAFAPSIGGAETYVMQLARDLAARAKRRSSAGGGEAPVTIATATDAGCYDDTGLPFQVVRRPGLRALWRLLKESDVVHLAGPTVMPLALGLLRRRPVVVEHHGYQAICPNGLLFHHPSGSVCPGHFQARRYLECLRCNAATAGRARSFRMLGLAVLRRALSRRATANVAVSAHVCGRLGLPRTVTIPHGVPEVQAATAAPASPPLFAYVGRLVAEKGVHLLLEAGGQVRDRGYDFRLVIIGDGPERTRLEALATMVGLREKVSFRGFLEGTALEATLENVSALVMPTLMEETAGIAALEQMARGRAVIASDTGGLREVVAEAGLRFAPGDAAGLASCLETALKDPRALEALGAKARDRTLRRFGARRMTDAHAAVYVASLRDVPLLDSLTRLRLRRLSSLFRGRVLDVGCGDKPYLPEFLGVAEPWVGLDRSIASSADVVGDTARLPLRSEAFDTVLATLLLDDLPEPASLFAEARRVLRAGGHLVATAPQCAASQDAPHDYFRFTRFSLERLAASAGLEVVSLETLGGAAAHLAALLLRHRPLARSRFASRVVRSLLLWLDARFDTETDPLAWILVCRKV